jgi:hypothetical protein
MRRPVLIIILGALIVLGAFPVTPASAHSAAEIVAPARIARANPTLRRGSIGAPVKELQQRLNTWLPNAPKPRPAPLVVDGIFGAKTEAAVHTFQQAMKLEVDGIVGPKTWARLLARETAQAPVSSRPAPSTPAVEPTDCGTFEVCIHQHEQRILLIREDLIGKPYRVWLTDSMGQHQGHELLYAANPGSYLLLITGRGRGYGLRLEPGDYAIHLAAQNDATPPMVQPFRVLRTTPPEAACRGIAAPVNATVDIYTTIPVCYSMNKDITTMQRLSVALKDFAPGSPVKISVIDSGGQQRGRQRQVELIAGSSGSEVEVDACGCDFGIHYAPGDYTLIFEQAGGRRATVPFRILPRSASVDL